VLATAALAPRHAYAEIHRCAQPDGTVRYQDRPCAAAAPTVAPAVAAPGEARSAAVKPSALVAPLARSTSPPTRPHAPIPDVDVDVDAAPRLPATRADYVARNEARCAEGDRRACAAVTCERSGRLDSTACQAAVGYHRGAGWDVRPRSDLYDPGRTHDEFVLTCRASGHRATLVRDRASEAYAWPGRNAPAVNAAALPAAAAEFCERKMSRAP
jgi:hypothetical protein